MQNSKFKYDVAFSFVFDDEVIATNLNDLLQDRLLTFLYSQKQSEIAGADGEKIFNAVFGQEARIVVVIYRSKWGKTPWTRIEETAIRNRAYSEGYDFVIFIPVEDSSKLPKWLPKVQIWYDYKRWGLEGAAAIIESRARNAGSEFREESAIDLAKRLKRQSDFEEFRNTFLHSVEGVYSADCEFGKIYDLIQLKSIEIKKHSDLMIEYQRTRDGYLAACAGGYCVSIYWNQEYSNSLRDSFLSVKFWDGLPSIISRNRLHDNTAIILETKYDFDINRVRSVGWFDRQKSKFYISDLLAEHILQSLLGIIKDDHSRKNS